MQKKNLTLHSSIYYSLNRKRGSIQISVVFLCKVTIEYESFCPPIKNMLRIQQDCHAFILYRNTENIGFVEPTSLKIFTLEFFKKYSFYSNILPIPNCIYFYFNTKQTNQQTSKQKKIFEIDILLWNRSENFCNSE